VVGRGTGRTDAMVSAHSRGAFTHFHARACGIRGVYAAESGLSPCPRPRAVCPVCPVAYVPPVACTQKKTLLACTQYKDRMNATGASLYIMVYAVLRLLCYTEPVCTVPGRLPRSAQGPHATL